MSSREGRVRHLSTDDLPQIPSALVGNVREYITSIIARERLPITELYSLCNNPENLQTIPTKMIYLYNRRESFTEEGKEFVFPKDVAEAGFFLIDDDTLRCHECGRDAKDWKNTDDPWLRHAELSPKCPHIKKRIRWKDGIAERRVGVQRLLSCPD